MLRNYFRRLRPYVFGGRQVAHRDALVRAFIARQPEGKTLLDAGAGPQRFRAAGSHLKYISQDFAQYQGGDDFAGEKLGKWDTAGCELICDITAIPLADGSVDSIICVEVFEHLKAPILALREFSRLLKPDSGRLLITAPFNSQYHQMPFFFYSGFSSEFYRVNGSEAGLKVISVTPIGDYYESIAQELLRLPFLKTNVLLKVLGFVSVLPAYAIVLLLHTLKVPAPRSPLCYVIELSKN